MSFSHCFLALFGQLWRNFAKNVLCTSVKLQIIVLKEVQTTVSKCASSWPDFKHFELRKLFLFELAEHKVGHRVAVEGLEELTRCYPGVFRVQTLHFLPIVVVASELVKLNRFL